MSISLNNFIKLKNQKKKNEKIIKKQEKNRKNIIQKIENLNKIYELLKHNNLIYSKYYTNEIKDLNENINLKMQNILDKSIIRFLLDKYKIKYLKRKIEFKKKRLCSLEKNFEKKEKKIFNKRIKLEKCFKNNNNNVGYDEERIKKKNRLCSLEKNFEKKEKKEKKIFKRIKLEKYFKNNNNNVGNNEERIKKIIDREEAKIKQYWDRRKKEEERINIEKKKTYKRS